MKRFFLIILALTVSCKDAVKEKVKDEMQKKVKTPPNTEVASSFNLEIYDYDGLKPLINKVDDKVHVVNFWATWCAPCIKELPYFEKINAVYKDKNVEVLLVSLDFPRQYETKLIPFIEKRNIESKVVCFDDVDQNRWIPAINKDWSGALPATIIYKGDKRQFYEQSFTQKELEKELKQFLN
ncbi:TlpA disulfide reductase family protein [Winogradskyella sp.]|uniref:TlpA family protein disulfide reductase n=1 Tax=Winogradskyella sp. TaxID=1883156 RepID=UPI0025E46D78|nr:TlpA disulfide reductase family protein [Winogradskyella sp.]MBT8244399.1 TlpA family protein disulfide reductase [Winogradskyella sp.]